MKDSPGCPRNQHHSALVEPHQFDNAYYDAHTAANRKPGAANQFDVSKAAVGRYFTTVEDCAVAAKLQAGRPQLTPRLSLQSLESDLSNH